MLNNLLKFSLAFFMAIAACNGPLRDKQTHEDENQLPDSIGTPGFVPDTTIRKDSNSEKFRYLDSLWKSTDTLF